MIVSMLRLTSISQIHRALQAREAEVTRLAELLEEDLVQGKGKGAARAANSKIIEQLNSQVCGLAGSDL